MVFVDIQRNNLPNGACLYISEEQTMVFSKAKTFQPSIGCLIIHYILQTFFQTYISSTIVCTILAEIENKEFVSGRAWLFIKLSNENL